MSISYLSLFWHCEFSHWEIEFSFELFQGEFFALELGESSSHGSGFFGSEVDWNVFHFQVLNSSFDFFFLAVFDFFTDSGSERINNFGLFVFPDDGKNSGDLFS